MIKKTIFRFIMIIMIVMTIKGAIATPNIVSFEDNLIKITSWEFAECKGNICTYEFVIENLDSVNRFVNISNTFEKDIDVLKFERWQEIYITKEVNTPYISGSYEDIINGTLQNVSIWSDNITTENISYFGWAIIPSVKYNKELKTTSSQKILLHKESENTFRVIVRQPLGQSIKFDIMTSNWDDTQTILDPFVDTNNYYIDLTFDFYDFEDQTTGDNTPYGWVAFPDSDWEVSTTSVLAGSKSLYANPSNDARTEGLNITTIPNIENSTIGFKISFPSINNGLVQYHFRKQDTNNYYYFQVLWGSSTKKLYFGKVVGGVSTTLDQKVFSYVNGEVCDVFISNIGNYLNYTWDCPTYDYSLNINDTDINGSGGHYLGYYDGSGRFFTVDNLNITTLDNTNIHNSFQSGENLSINSSFTGVQIDYDSDVVIQLNDTALGNNLVSGSCYGLLDTSLSWSIKVNNSFDLSRVVNYTFMDCPVSVSSSGGRGSFIEFEGNCSFSFQEWLLDPLDFDIFSCLDSEIFVNVPSSSNSFPVSKAKVSRDFDRFLMDPHFDNLIIVIKDLFALMFQRSEGRIVQ